MADQTIWEVFEAERPKLVPYAGWLDGFHAATASVSKTCLVRFDNNNYSVASALRNGVPFKDWVLPAASGSGASVPAPTMAIGRWSTSSTRC